MLHLGSKQFVNTEEPLNGEPRGFLALFSGTTYVADSAFTLNIGGV